MLGKWVCPTSGGCVLLVGRCVPLVVGVSY